MLRLKTGWAFVIENQSNSSSATDKWIVIGILLASLVLRSILILRGGQYYNSDETRYEVSRAAAQLLTRGPVGTALEQFTISPEHLGFKIIGLLPALLEQVTGPNLVIPALFFSLFSVLNLYLIFLISRSTSKTSAEPIFALAFAASSLSLLYYSRHLFPYDLSLSFGLLAVYIPLVRKQTRKTSFLCGCMSFLCFISYNGYWPLAGFAILVHSLAGENSLQKIPRKAIVTGLGFVIPLVLVILAMLASGTDLIAAYRLFSTSITQGVFEEGWSLPFEYFWHTEYVIALGMAALATLAIIRPQENQKEYNRLWLGGILFIYLCLVIPSLLNYFVVYARLARQILPFLILLATQGLTQLENRFVYRRQFIWLIFIAVGVQAAWNYAAAYRIGFPRDFVAEAQARFPGFEFSSKRLAYGAPVICRHNEYMIENAKFYLAPPETIPQVQGQLQLSAPHPVNYLPYLYEGDPPEFRQVYRALKIQMRFYSADPEFMSETNPAWTGIENCVVREN